MDPVVELPEGATVTVLVDDDANDGDLELTTEEEAELDDAIAEADRGGWIPAEQVLAELKPGLPDDILGPAPLFRLRGRFRAQLVAKTNRPRAVASSAAHLLAAAAPAMRRDGLTAVVDVDPQSV